MLPVLTVSGQEGLLYLNGHLCGPSGCAALPLSMDGTHYLEFRPWGASFAVTLRLTVHNGLLETLEPEDACAVQWPGGWIALEFPQVQSAQPQLLCTLEKGFDTFLLVDEGDFVSFGRDASEAVSLPLSRARNARLFSIASGLAAEGECDDGRFLALFSTDSPPQTLCCVCGDSVSLQEDGQVFCTRQMNDFRLHIRRQLWSPDASGVYTLEKEHIAPDASAPLPHLPEEWARCWLEALSLGCLQEASECLQDASLAESFRRVAGDFDLLVPLEDMGFSAGGTGLLKRLSPTVARVRKLSFRFDSRSGKILEVTEGA